MAVQFTVNKFATATIIPEGHMLVSQCRKIEWSRCSHIAPGSGSGKAYLESQLKNGMYVDLGIPVLGI